MYQQLLGRYISGYPSSDIKTSTTHCPTAHSTGTRRIKQILWKLHLRIYLVHIINNFADLWYWFHVFIFAYILEQGQKMKIATTAFLYIQSWKSYWISIYIVMLSIPMEFAVRLHLHHTHHHSQHTRSSNLQSTDRDQYRQVRLFCHWQRLLEKLGALASDKLSNCLWSWWKICHDWYPLSIFHQLQRQLDSLSDASAPSCSNNRCQCQKAGLVCTDLCLCSEDC